MRLHISLNGFITAQLRKIHINTLSSQLIQNNWTPIINKKFEIPTLEFAQPCLRSYREMVLHGRSYLQLSSKMLYVSLGFLKQKQNNLLITFYLYITEICFSPNLSMLLKNRIPLIYIFNKFHFYQRHLLYQLLLHTEKTK